MRVQSKLITIIILSVSILFGVLMVQNNAANETKEANNNTAQKSSNNAGTNGNISSKTTNTTTTTNNTTTKSTTGTNTEHTINTTNTTTTATKSSNANLSNLGIKPYDFSGFKAETTSYKAIVPESTETIEVYAKTQHAKATVTGTGKQNLQEGDNELEIVVTAEDGTKKTYTIHITRGEEQGEYEGSGNGLLDLKISNLELSPEFSTNVYEYTAKYIGEDTQLELEAKPTSEDYIVEVTGNENLQEGENTITILVSEKNGNNVATYQITLNKSLVDEEAIAREEAEKKAKEQKTIIGIVVAVVIIMAIIIVIVVKRKNKNIAADYSEVSLYGKNHHDDEKEKEELPKALKEEKVEETSDSQKEEPSNYQEEEIETTDSQEEQNDNQEQDEEEEIENMPKEKLKEKFLAHYSNYEEEYEADRKETRKKEKHKGKRFKE